MRQIYLLTFLLWATHQVSAQQSDTLKSYTLEEVKIQAQSILNKQSTDANKMPVQYLQSPQIYNSVSRVVLEKQIATTLEDAMHNIPGVTKLWDATGRTDGGSFFTSRGFYTSTKARNGLANIASTNMDMANIERIEVIKGPSATLFGSIITSYGGVINRITKKPMFKSASTAQIAVGTQGFYRGQVDVNAPLYKTLAVRVIGAWQNQDSWQDVGNQKNYLITPSLTYMPNNRLQIDLEAEFLGSDANSGGGSHIFFLTPSTINSSIRSFLSAQGMPESSVNDIMKNAPKTFKEAFGVDKIQDVKVHYDRSYLNKDIRFKSNTASFFGTSNYILSENWRSQTSITYSNTKNDGYMGYQYLLPNYLLNFAQSIGTGTPDFGTAGHDYLARMVWSPNGNADNFEVQQNFISDHSWGTSMRNRAVFGLDYSRFKSDIVYTRFYGSLAGIPYPDLFDIVPAYAEVPNYKDFNLQNVEKSYKENTSGSLNYQYTNQTYSAYLNDLINLNEYIILNAGLRLDHFRYTTPTAGDYNQTTLSPKFGIILSPWKDKASLFGNYQNGFTNKNGVDFNNKPFKPEEAHQWEAGLKYQLFEQKLTGSISYYDIQVKDIVRTDPENPLFSIQDGTQKSKGIELEVLANPLRGWTIMAGYGYNDSKYTKSDPDVLDKRPAGSGPKNTANFWTNYTFTSGIIKGFGAGISANYASEAYAISNNTDGDLVIPAYTLLGVHITYDTRHWKAGLKINNLSDEKYWMGWTNMIPQRPRQAILTLGYKL
ncbi:TonB-dependent siderophore receptor [Leadbetterella byssophila DSM 17132]|uniref:TonB-dependent siderophore receptor n=1 Tax=Leadbetterella byssophila (strain DSM 17132 / JCM 16389 / KACC 11308 / NBRC 106382 / 4M15) TaxID=649349 RepID=E4RVT2_LEAB4|nr:TonB-dependent siderophore receptor [Leadbetterella byssophila]ADQ17980.1 TonB-dependent siderophore receptor [Leadbetterella byssophila DSM 17132]